MASEVADRHLDQVFNAKTEAETEAAYDRWSATYDQDMLSVGYLHPAVGAAMVARYVADRDQPILDAGCGTGVNGQILSTVGYSSCHGLDMSRGMLARARERSVYSELHQGTLGDSLPFPLDAFAAVVATGVFTRGHAPPSGFDELLRVTRPGGYLVFSIARTVWNDAGFREKLNALEAAGQCELVEETPWYNPMPLSEAEKASAARMFVYRVVKSPLRELAR